MPKNTNVFKYTDFSYPNAIAMKHNGNILIANTGADNIMEFAPNGNFVRYIGSRGEGDGQFYGPSGIAVDNLDNIFAVDLGNYRIVEFSSNGTFIKNFGWYGISMDESYLVQPSSIALNTNNDVYVTNTGSNNIAKFNHNGDFVEYIGEAGSGDGQFDYPQQITFDASNRIYVADMNNQRIQILNSDSAYNNQFGSYGGGYGTFSNPVSVSLDSDGNIYVGDNNGPVQKFSSNAEFITVIGNYGNTDGNFYSPRGCVFDSSNNMYVLDSSNSNVQKFDSSGNYLSKLSKSGSGNGQFIYPIGVAFDSNNNMYVLDMTGSNFQKFDSNGNFVGKYAGIGSDNGLLQNPTAIAIDNNDNIYITDPLDVRVSKFDVNGNWISNFGSYGSGDGQFLSPVGVAADSNGNVFITDLANHRVQKWDSNGTYIKSWGGLGNVNTVGKFSSPKGIYVDSEDNVLVVDGDNARVQKFTNDGTYITKFGSWGTDPGQFYGAAAITGDNLGNYYVVDTNNHRIEKFSNDGTFIATYGSYGTADNQFNYPGGMGTNRDGFLYVADTWNQRVVQSKFAFQINVDASLVIKDDLGTDFTTVSQNGIIGNKDLNLLTTSGLIISSFSANLSNDLDFSTVSADSDVTQGKSFIANLNATTFPEISATHDLYIPIPTGQNPTQVIICPLAQNLAAVTEACLSGYPLSVGSKASKVTIDGQQYWKVIGMTGTGGISVGGIPALGVQFVEPQEIAANAVQEITLSFISNEILANNSLIVINWDSGYTGGINVNVDVTKTGDTNYYNRILQDRSSTGFTIRLVTGGALDTTNPFVITLGATGNQLTTPATKASYEFYAITFASGVQDIASDTYSGLQYIQDSNDVLVDAVVPPVIDMELFADASTTTNKYVCHLNSLSVSMISICQYYIGTGTNNTTGLIIKQSADGQLHGQDQGHNFTVASGNLEAGTEGYGYRLTTGTHYTGVSGNGTTDTGVNTVGEASLATTSENYDTILANPSDRLLVTHRATMSSDTPADSYKQVVTYTAYSK